METVNIEFSEWFCWNKRKNGNKIRDRMKHPGIYILARFEKDKQPKNKAKPTDNNIIYIGETCNQTLHKRLNQFHKSAFTDLSCDTPKKGHSGGNEYFKKRKKKKYSSNKELYVAVSEFESLKDIDEILQQFKIKYHERKLIFEISKKRLIHNKKVKKDEYDLLNKD